MRSFFCLIFGLLLVTAYAQQETQTNDTIYRTLSVVQADSLIAANNANPDFVIIDLRTPADYSGGHIINAININYFDADFSSQIAALDHSKRYLLYCVAGSRSLATFNLMQTQKFKEVYNMSGGMNAWLTAGYPTNTTTGISLIAAAKPRFIAWPNPATSTLNISTTESYTNGSLTLTDMNGTIIRSGLLTEDQNSLDISVLPIGAYILTLITDSQSASSTIIKK